MIGIIAEDLTGATMDIDSRGKGVASTVSMEECIKLAAKYAFNLTQENA